MNFLIRYVHDDLVEFYVNENFVWQANYDQHGSEGMRSMEKLFVATADALNATVIVE